MFYLSFTKCPSVFGINSYVFLFCFLSFFQNKQLNYYTKIAHVQASIETAEKNFNNSTTKFEMNASSLAPKM